MKAYRQYYEKKTTITDNDALSWSTRAQLLGQVTYRGDIERYFNEWLYLPSEKNLSTIKVLIENLQINTFVALPNIQAFYKKKDNAELLNIAKTFLKNRYVLFSGHGGGARDWTVERYLTPDSVIKGFEEILASEGGAVHPEQLNNPLRNQVYKQDADAAFRMHEAPGMFQRLDYLIQFKEKKSIPREIENSLLELAQKLGYKNTESFVDTLIAYHLAEVQFRIQTALTFKMTPEQIATDTALLYEKNGWEKYRLSNTYKYYSTYRPYTVQWYLGYDIARAIPGL